MFPGVRAHPASSRYSSPPTNSISRTLQRPWTPRVSSSLDARDASVSPRGHRCYRRWPPPYEKRESECPRLTTFSQTPPRSARRASVSGLLRQLSTKRGRSAPILAAPFRAPCRARVGVRLRGPIALTAYCPPNATRTQDADTSDARVRSGRTPPALHGFTPYVRNTITR